MFDAKDRQALADRLKGKIRKASSNITTKFEAEKGDYKIVLSSDVITQLYKGNKVAELKSAELDEQVLEYVNSDPSEAVSTMLEQFIETYKPQENEVTASVNKEAANKAVNEDTWTRTTEKQLSDKKVDLHPRTNEYHNVTTEKQLPAEGQRPGTYAVTTEGQFRDERNTFYGDDRAHDWKQEDRQAVTEKQLDNGIKDYSDFGGHERGEVGSVFDGGLEAQHYMVGEKQLIELLSHHEWKEPKTTTQGKDQLGKQDGELARVTAEVAQSIVKEALNALGNTVLSVGVTPQELGSIVGKLVSHPSKYQALAHTIDLFKAAKLDINPILSKVSKAKYFGKTANTHGNWSPLITADVLVRQLSKLPFSSKHIVDGLVAMAGDSSRLVKTIDETTNNIVASKDEVKTAADENLDVFKQVLAGCSDCIVQGSADDGMYSFEGSLSEVSENPDNQQLFSEAAATYAKTKIAANVGKDINLVAQVCEVNKEKGVFSVTFKDSKFIKDELAVRAANRREMLKEAQFGGPAGGAPPGGADTTAPGMPAGAPPAAPAPTPETMTAPPPAPEDAGAGSDEGGTGEALPPGSVCGACGSKDVDVDNGELRCNACGAQGTVTVNTEWKKWPNVLNETGAEDADKPGFGLDEPGIGSEDAGSDIGGDPAAAGGDMGGGSGATLPTPPIGASIRITPLVMQKLAEQKIQLGKVCPNCGSQKTDVYKAANSRMHNGICWSCMQEYGFQVKANKNKKYQVYAQYTWLPRSASACSECTRSLQSPLKVAFRKSLDNYGMRWDVFNAMPFEQQASTVLKMANLGVLDLSTNMQAELPVKKYAASARWDGYSRFDKFPSSSCIERIARRYGENATSMSGPCQGKKLAQCVCGQLENLGIYTDGLAAKVASLQASKNQDINSPVEACAELLMNNHKFSLKQACIACDGLRAAHASIEDLIVESISELSPIKSAQMMPPAPPTPMPAKPMPKPMSAGPMDVPAPMPAVPMTTPPSSPMPASPMGGPPGMGGPAKPMGTPDEGGLDGPGGAGGLDGGLDGGLGDSGPMGDTGLDTMSPMDVDMGMGEGSVTIKLPEDLANSLEETLSILQRALGGDIGNDMIDDFGGDLGGSDDLGGDVGGELGDDDGSGEGSELGDTDDMSPTSGDSVGEENTGGEVPGIIEDNDGGSDLKKEGLPEGSSEDKPSGEKSDNPFKKDEGSDKPKDSGDDEKSEAKEMPMHNTNEEHRVVEVKDNRQAGLDSFLNNMKTGKIRTASESTNSLFESLIRQSELASKIAKKEKNDEIKKMEYKDVKEEKLKETATQDSKEVGKYQDGGKIQNEEPFSKGVVTKVDVPRGDALMGSEGSEAKLNEKENLPKIPKSDGKLKEEVNDVKSEETTTVDGNQGRVSNASTTKIACKCGTNGCDCSCKKDACGKPCMAAPKKASTDDKFVVSANHKFYDAFLKKAEAGNKSVKLANGKTYSMSLSDDKKIILTAEEGKSVEVKKVEEGLSKDKDIGPVQNDKTHSLAVDEKKPSEGMNKPEVPEAPNGGRLTNEEISEKASTMPSIPTGGGMNPQYDKNDAYKPEKTDQMLGNTQTQVQGGTKRDEAVKIAGQMLKAELISIDDLPAKIAELSQATPELLKNIELALNQNRPTTTAQTKVASSNSQNNNSVMNKILTPTGSSTQEEGVSLKDSIQSLFKLDKTNKLHQQFAVIE